MIKATFVVDGEGVAAFAKYLAERNGAYRRSRMVASATVIVVFVSLGMGLAGQLERRDSLTILALVLLVGIVVGLSVYRSYPHLAMRVARRSYASDPAPAILGRQRIVIDSRSLRITNDHVTPDYQWSAITQLGESKDCLFAFIGPFQAIIIPKARLHGATPEAVVRAIRSYAVCPA